MTSSNGEHWFAPKRYGYGAGLPLTWQAWLLCFVYCAAVTLAAWFLLPRTAIGFTAIVIVATIAFLIVSASRTRGGWRWRWGDKD